MGGGSSTIVGKKISKKIMSLLFMRGGGDYLSSWLARKGFAFCGWDGQVPVHVYAVESSDAPGGGVLGY